MTETPALTRDVGQAEHALRALLDPLLEETDCLESEPYRRLSYTWHSFTPELIAALDLGEDVAARLAAERRSKVTFDIEPLGDVVKLTVIHDDLEPGGVTASMISQGWSSVLSNLKNPRDWGTPYPTARRAPAWA
jgi:Activator of Hsp90 ATPase homolog 1-like protein